MATQKQVETYINSMLATCKNALAQKKNKKEWRRIVEYCLDNFKKTNPELSDKQ